MNKCCVTGGDRGMDTVSQEHLGVCRRLFSGKSEEATINLKLNCYHTQILPRSDTRETTSAIAIVLCSNVEVRMEG